LKKIKEAKVEEGSQPKCKKGIFSRKKFATSEIVHAQSFGQKLAEARRQKKQTLEEVEHFTKIRLKYLEMLESDRLELLPKGAAGKGLLRTYCNYLGVDCRSYSSSLELQKVPSVPPPPPKPLKKMPFALNIHPRKLGLALAVILAIGAFGYIFSQIISFAAPPKITLVQPAQNAEVNVDTVLVEGSTEAGSELFINGQKVATDVSGGFKEQVKLTPGSNTIKIMSRSKTGKESRLERVVIGKFEEVLIPPTPTNTPLPPDFIEVELLIEESVTWVTVDVDGRQEMAGMINPGAKKKFLGKQIVINTGKAHTTKIKLNGKEWGPVPNTNGIVENLVLTIENVVR